METLLYVGGGELGPTLLSRAGTLRQLAPGEGHLLRRGRFAPSRREYLVRYAADAGEALSLLDARDIDLAIVDERGQTAGSFEESLTARLCRALDASGSFRLRDRVFVLLDEGPFALDQAFSLGRLKVASVLGRADADELFARIEARPAARKGGKIALCLAGGGIEGLIYELGVLRALETFLPTSQLIDFDIFCGISAGALIGAFLANGVGPDDVARGLKSGSGRIDRIGRSDVFDLNLEEIGRRTRRLAWELTQPTPGRVAAALWRAVPAGLFAGKRLERYLEAQLARPGMTNAFSQLRRKLYVGVTDQDTSEHVVFGTEGLTHVPISRAVRASTALAPFYPPVRIDGRNYVDGGFTRTANLTVAVNHGARLVIVVDPLIPVSAEPGYVERRGGAFGAVQGLKAFMQSRFKRSLAKFRELHPEVDVLRFSPEGEETRIMSGTMMRYTFRVEVEEVAFGSTIQKLRSRFAEYSADFARHGLTLKDPRDVHAARAGSFGVLDRERLLEAI